MGSNVFDEFGKPAPKLVQAEAGFGEIKENVQKDLKALIEDRQHPFMWAVDALPRQDLAQMADAPVNLTAFLQHMLADQEETVGGPIDVALLSKGEGFVWIKHKNLGVVAI